MKTRKELLHIRLSGKCCLSASQLQQDRDPGRGGGDTGDHEEEQCQGQHDEGRGYKGGENIC